MKDDIVLSSAILKRDKSTGLAIGETFKADSGFEYMLGVRRFRDLKIVENVGQGTAVCYLNAVRVFNREGELIIDKQVERDVHYSRETVRRIVLDELLHLLEEATLKKGKVYDKEKAKEKINAELKLSYYKESYASVLKFASELGIEFE